MSFRVTPGCWGVLPVVRLSRNVTRNVRGSEAGVASHRPRPVLSLLLKRCLVQGQSPMNLHSIHKWPEQWSPEAPEPGPKTAA